MKQNGLHTEINSPTIVDSFSSLLKRAPDERYVTTQEFQVSLKQLKSRKLLCLSSPIYFCDLCWEVFIYPFPEDEQAYSISLEYLDGSVIYNREVSEVKGIVTVESIREISSIQLSNNCTRLQGIIHENMFQDISETHLKFAITVSLHEKTTPTHLGFFESYRKKTMDTELWKTNKEFRNYWMEIIFCDGDSSRVCGWSFSKVLLAHLTCLFTESVIQQCYLDDWSGVFLSLVNTMIGLEDTAELNRMMSRVGVSMLIAKLLAADFSEGSRDHRTHRVLHSLGLLLLEHGVSGGQCFDGASFDEIFANVIAKFSDQRYNVELLSYFTVHFLVVTAHCRIERCILSVFADSKLASTAFKNFDVLLPFLDVRTMNTIVRLPYVTEDKFNMYCEVFDTFLHLLNSKRNFGKLSKATAKKALELMCENYNNPFYAVASTRTPLPFHILQRNPASTIVLEWCRKNKLRNPFMVFPATIWAGLGAVEYFVNLTGEGSQLDTFIKYYSEEHRPFIRLLITDYRSAFVTGDPSYKPRKSAKSAERLKEEGNTLYREGGFAQAASLYTDAIAILQNEIFFMRSTGRHISEEEEFFSKVNMAAMCRNNRSASCLELKCYNEALSDVVLVINELASLSGSGTHPHVPTPVSQLTFAHLEARMIKAKFRRVKILVGMEQWVAALHCSLDIIEHHQTFVNQTIPYYWLSLVRYSESASFVLYPTYCVLCYAYKSDSEEYGIDDTMILQQTRLRCKKCGHYYCSMECHRKDAAHKIYCAQLAKIRKHKP